MQPMDSLQRKDRDGKGRDGERERGEMNEKQDAIERKHTAVEEICSIVALMSKRFVCVGLCLSICIACVNGASTVCSKNRRLGGCKFSRGMAVTMLLCQWMLAEDSLGAVAEIKQAERGDWLELIAGENNRKRGERLCMMFSKRWL